MFCHVVLGLYKKKKKIERHRRTPVSAALSVLRPKSRCRRPLSPQPADVLPAAVPVYAAASVIPLRQVVSLSQRPSHPRLTQGPGAPCSGGSTRAGSGGCDLRRKGPGRKYCQLRGPHMVRPSFSSLPLKTYKPFLPRGRLGRRAPDLRSPLP